MNGFLRHSILLGSREDGTVVAPGFLQNPAVKNWLGGIVPAWTILDQKSFEALLLPPLPPVGAIRFASDFSPEEIGQSTVARNALILLHSASVGPGLKLTTTGNLSRSVVAEMVDLFTWPGFDKTEAFRLHKVINEPDFLPLYFVRHLVETAELVRQRKSYLGTTPAGRQVLEDPAREWFQLPAGGERKRASQSVGYEFRTKFAEVRSFGDNQPKRDQTGPLAAKGSQELLRKTPPLLGLFRNPTFSVFCLVSSLTKSER